MDQFLERILLLAAVELGPASATGAVVDTVPDAVTSSTRIIIHGSGAVVDADFDVIGADVNATRLATGAIVDAVTDIVTSEAVIKLSATGAMVDALTDVAAGTGTLAVGDAVDYISVTATFTVPAGVDFGRVIAQTDGSFAGTVEVDTILIGGS